MAQINPGVGGGGGGSDVQYTDGNSAPAHPTGDALEFVNGSGDWETVGSSSGLPVNVVAGGGAGGTSSTFGAAYPGTGTAVGATDGTNMQPLKVDGSDNLLVKVNAAIPAGTNTVGSVKLTDGTNSADVTTNNELYTAPSVYQASPPGTYTDGQRVPLLTDNYGQAKVVVVGTPTISGSVTANAGTNLNTSALALESGGNLASIKADTDKIPSKGTAVTANSTPVNIASDQIVPVSASTLPLPTGAATSANQSTEITSLSTIATNTGNTATDVATLTSSSAGGYVRQDSNGTIAKESGGNLATIATNTTGLNSTVGTAGSATPSKGVVVQGSDGTDARALKTDSSGNLDVNVQGTVPVSGTFWQTIQPVSASSLPLPTGAALATNQTGGGQKTQIVDGSGNVIGSNSNALAVFVTNGGSGGTASNFGSAFPTAGTAMGASNGTNMEPLNVDGSGFLEVNVEASALPTGAATASNQATGNTSLSTIGTNTTGLNNAVGTAGSAIPTKGVIAQGSDGTNARALKTDTSGNLGVNVQGTAAVSGTFWQTTQPVSGTVTANAGTGNFTVIGQSTGVTAPTTAVETGDIAATALPTAVTNGQLVGAMADKFGRQVVLSQATRDIVGQQSTTITSSTSATTVVSTIASTFTDIASIAFANSSASATLATLSDGTNSYYFWVPAGDMRGAVYQVPLPATTVNTTWTVTCGTSVASLYVTVEYIKNK